MVKNSEVSTEPRSHKSAPTSKITFAVTRRQSLSGLALILVIIIGFVGGIHYEKHQQTANNSQSGLRTGRFGSMANGANGFGGGPGNGNGGSGTRAGARGGMRNGIFGQVTAISATGITVNNARSGTDETLTVTSATTVTDNGQTAAISDIKVGDNVLVHANSADGATDAPRTATQILLNPQIGRRGNSQIPSQSN